MTDASAPEPPKEMTRRAIEQLEAERDKLERLLVRLPALLAELDPERLTVGVVEAARELTGARFGIFLDAGEMEAVYLEDLSNSSEIVRDRRHKVRLSREGPTRRRNRPRPGLPRNSPFSTTTSPRDSTVSTAPLQRRPSYGL